MSRPGRSAPSREDLEARFEAARERTLALVAGLDPELAQRSPHPDFSPIVWHLGHIAYTEARWLLEYAQGSSELSEPQAYRFSQERSPKAERSRLCPDLSRVLEYMERVRERVRASFAALPDDLLWVVLQHEYQHCETIAVVAFLLGGALEGAAAEPPGGRDPAVLQGFVEVEGGCAVLGSDEGEEAAAYDNEKPRHEVELAPFALARRPVTCGEWLEYVEAGEGRRPRSWLEDGSILTPLGPRPFDPALPVYGVSWDEAVAFARAHGCRLPTEAEWEWAARGPQRRRYPWGEATPAGRCDRDLHSGGPAPVGAYPEGDSPEGLVDLAGGVWEWTASTFEPRPGFRPWPYRGYSMPYFDGRHRVLKGGSFATRETILRAAFRNWYPPNVREIFSGLRLAR